MNPTINTRLGHDNAINAAGTGMIGDLHCVTPAATQRDPVFGEFQSPGVAYRGKPFWSWNGSLNKKELLRQLHIFKEMGMGGAFMHSRTGLKTEYLGDQWFDLINACADECEKLGLEAWLYDEDRWPSGSAGGMATENPAFRMKSVKISVLSPAEMRWPKLDAFIAAFTAEVNGLNLGNYTRLEYGRPVPTTASGKILLFEIAQMVENSFYNGNTYLDTLKRDATEHFLQLTHEKYRERCGKRLGTSIKGIFTDEPHHGFVMCHDDAERTPGNLDWTVPYTDALFEQFEAMWRYDLRERLPELFLFPGGRRVSQVKWHYMELIQHLFIENWAKPCLEWCRTNQMLLTGHVLHEDSLVAQAVPCGSVMRYYEHMDYPGVDLLCNDNRSYWVAKQLQSAARQLGKKWLLSELYGCTGWQFDFAGHKETGFWQALFGINLRCHHLAWVTMAGEAKRDYPASIGFQSGWYREYKLVEDFFSRLHVVLQRGEPACDVLVVNPVESVWAQIHPGWAQWLGAKDPVLRELEQKYEDLFHWLSGAQIDFDYGDEDHLKRFGKIVSVEGEPRIQVGLGSYRVVVVGTMETIRSSTLELLADFHAAGGKVLFVGDPPRHLDALPSVEPAHLADSAMRTRHDRDPVVAAVKANSCSPISVHCDTNAIFCQVRREGDRLYVVAINTSRTDSFRNVSFQFAGLATVQEWDCISGERFRHPSRAEGRATTWAADFPPLGALVFIVSNRDSDSLRSRPVFNPTRRTEARGPFEYHLDEPNLCVLDFASFRLGDGEWRSEAEILKVDMAVRKEMELPQRSGTMIQPWSSEKLGLFGAFEPVALDLRFSFETDTLPAAPVDLVMEMPERFEILLNGAAIAIPSEPAWLIDPCLKRIPLPPGVFRLGQNEIELRTAFVPDTDLEAIYLAGSFGVTFRGECPVLGVLPGKLNPSDVTSQGLPFYSGTISYRIPLPAPAEPDSKLRFETGPFGGAVARVGFEESVNPTAIAWPPYEATIECPSGAREVICDVLLTRINTFGPLHLAPKEQNGIGPFSFRTEGAEFSRAPQLWPAGLLQAPVTVEGE